MTITYLANSILLNWCNYVNYTLEHGLVAILDLDEPNDTDDLLAHLAVHSKHWGFKVERNLNMECQEQVNTEILQMILQTMTMYTDKCITPAEVLDSDYADEELEGTDDDNTYIDVDDE